MKKIILLITLIMLCGCIHKPIINATIPVSTGAVHVDIPIDNTAGVVVFKDTTTIEANNNNAGINNNANNNAGVNDNNTEVNDNQINIHNTIIVPTQTVTGIISTLKPWQFIFIMLILAVVGIICFMIYVNKKK